MADAEAMPDVRELADAITIAFDDLRTLGRPGEADPEDDVARRRRPCAPRAGSPGPSTGAVAGAMGKVARQVMNTAVETAVSQVTGRGRKTAAAPRRRRAR